MVNIQKIKLDKTDRIILAQLDKNCRIHSNKLAKLTKKSRQSIDYRIKRLVEEKVITSFNTAINPHKMGYKIYKLYLQLRNVPSEKQKIFKFLRNSGFVYWMGECDGTWDFICGFYSKSDQDYYNLKNKLVSEFGHIIVKRFGDVIVDVKQYEKMYFTNKIQKPTMFGGKIENNKMTELDLAILDIIVNNARIPIVELAKKTKTTPQTVSNRIKRMQDLGIIIQYRIGINLDALGLELYKAIIHIDRYTQKDEKELLNYISSYPNMHYFIRNIWNIEPELVVSDYHEYSEIIDEIKMKFPHVIRNVESVVMKTDEWTPGFKNIFHARD
ncbi:MAG: winged helix-turn-helix transcriptional regulator [Candidatus Micrarchaeota archaeon]